MDKINKVIHDHKQGPKQGSKEWLKLKYGSDEVKLMGSIGGSEIAIITGDNKYCNLNKFIKQRCGLDKGFTDNKYTRWGIVFEDQIQLLVELIMKCEIKSMNYFEF